MLRRSFLKLLGISLLGFLPYHLRMPAESRRRNRKYYVDIEGDKPKFMGVTPDGKITYGESRDGQWIITRIEC